MTRCVMLLLWLLAICALLMQMFPSAKGVIRYMIFYNNVDVYKSCEFHDVVQQLQMDGSAQLCHDVPCQFQCETTLILSWVFTGIVESVWRVPCGVGAWRNDDVVAWFSLIVSVYLALYSVHDDRMGIYTIRTCSSLCLKWGVLWDMA